MSGTALLVVDMLNDYDHDDGDALAENVAGMLGPLVDLVNRARRHDDVDLVYVNDNHGDFAADFTAIAAAARGGRHPELVEPVLPRDGEMTLTKVRHSVFFSTALDYLLRRLGTRTVVLTGQATEQCILYSALDCYVRHFDVVVPPDAVAHIDPALGDAALTLMERNMRARLLTAEHCVP